MVDDMLTVQEDDGTLLFGLGPNVYNFGSNFPIWFMHGGNEHAKYTKAYFRVQMHLYCEFQG